MRSLYVNIKEQREFSFVLCSLIGAELQKDLAVLALPGGCVPTTQGRKVRNTMHKKKLVSISLASLAALSLFFSFWAMNAQGAQQAHAASNGQSTTQASTNPYGDPNLVSMFDGKTLTGWTAAKAGEWVVKNGAIHGTGIARGWIYYSKQQVGSFRWIFNVRQVVGNHYPTVLIWGTTAPISGCSQCLTVRSTQWQSLGLPAGAQQLW